MEQQDYRKHLWVQTFLANTQGGRFTLTDPAKMADQAVNDFDKKFAEQAQAPARRHILLPTRRVMAARIKQIMDTERKGRTLNSEGAYEVLARELGYTFTEIADQLNTEKVSYQWQAWGQRPESYSD